MANNSASLVSLISRTWADASLITWVRSTIVTLIALGIQAYADPSHLVEWKTVIIILVAQVFGFAVDFIWRMAVTTPRKLIAELNALRKSEAELILKIADKGPRLRLFHQTKGLLTGLALTTDQSASNITFEEVFRANRTVEFSPVDSLEPGQPMILDPKCRDTDGSDVINNSLEALNWLTTEKDFDTVSVELSCFYFDLRGNQYTCKWVITWHSVFNWGSPAIKIDPLSYRYIPRHSIADGIGNGHD